MKKSTLLSLFTCFIFSILQSQVLFKDFNPIGSGSPERFTACGDFLFFRAISDSTGDYSLYRTDGTLQGTDQLKASQIEYLPTYLTCVDTNLYFVNSRWTSPRELWRSDGTVSGTMMLYPQGWDPFNQTNNFSSFNGKLYFSQGGDVVKIEYSSNQPIVTLVDDSSSPRGTQGGTYSYSRFPVYRNHLYFYGRDYSNPPVDAILHKTNGSVQGTSHVKTLVTNGFSFFRSFVESGNYAYFDSWYRINSFDKGVELWRTSGTSGGTQLVKDINFGEGDSNPSYLTDVNGTLFFNANDGNRGAELWKTQGGNLNTFLVKDINPTEASNPRSLVSFNGVLYFSASSDSLIGRELWLSDGSTAGTVLLKDINPTGSSDPQKMRVAGDFLYFTADDGINGRELWRTDGTALGTEMVDDINSSGSSSPDWLTYFNDALYFTADDGINGRELWILESNPLPVELLSFNGLLFNQNDVLLKWSSELEVDHDKYIIEHSTNGKVFKEVGQLPGLGTEIRGYQYQFIHKEPISGDNYYRLKFLDVEENEEYSEVIIISLDQIKYSLTISPTIASHEIQILIGDRLEKTNEKRHIEIWDIYGRRVNQISITEENPFLNVDVSNYPSGHYIVLLREKLQLITSGRFIKN